MPDFDTFWTGDRADGVAAIIADKPTTITVIRDNAADPAAMTVRLEALSSSPSTLASAISVSTSARVLVFAEAGADLVRGDRFWHDGQWFEISAILVADAYRTHAVGEARLPT